MPASFDMAGGVCITGSGDGPADATACPRSRIVLMGAPLRLKGEGRAGRCALAALDRVLMLEPAAKPALLLRASLLCRIDDKTGGSAQLARLSKRDFAKGDWNQVTSQCGKTAPAPAATKRSERWMRPGF